LEIVVCLTGASGAVYGVNLLKHLKGIEGVKVHLVASETGKLIVGNELGMGSDELVSLADEFFENHQMDAPIASGSVKFDALVIIPATMSTLSKISVGISDNLITRLGSVALKERRNFIVVFRETPISTIHLGNLAKLSQNGVVVMPASPGFYNGPKEIRDLVDSISSRVMDLLGIENEVSPRYEG
jgi:4-hydroxy-3-polyprenylbenzoate decarboxylase